MKLPRARRSAVLLAVALVVTISTNVLASQYIQLTSDQKATSTPLPGQTKYTIYDSSSGMNHAVMLQVFKDKLFAAWHHSDCCENSWPYTGLVNSASLTSLNTWSTAANVSNSTLDDNYRTYMADKYPEFAYGDVASVNTVPRGFLTYGETLYMHALGWVVLNSGAIYRQGRVFYTTDGSTWSETAPATLDTYSNLAPVRVSWTNHHYIDRGDGSLMAAGLDTSNEAAITSDMSGLSGWSGGNIDTSAASDVGEPSGWVGRDGTLHYAARVPGSTNWHAYSTNSGSTWDPLKSSPQFGDDPANKEFGRFANGVNWYVGQPFTGSGTDRETIALSLSDDGWEFNQTYLVEEAPTDSYLVEYPGGFTYGNNMYVAYGTDTREDITLSVSDVSDLIGAKSINAAEDTYVIQSSPTTNRGTATAMGVAYSASDERLAYLNFSVSGIAGKAINSLKLRLFESVANSNGNTSFQVKKTTSAWTETGVNWNNRPTLGSTVYGTYTAGSLTNGQWVDVTLDPSFLSGDGTYELALQATANSNESTFDTRETGSPTSAQLIVSYDPTLTVPSSSDTYVMQASPTIASGSSTAMGVRYHGTDQRNIYLKFPVSGVNDKVIESVKLRLEESTANSNGNTNFEVRETTSAWTEAAVTWNSRPSTGGTVYGSYSSGSLSDGQVVDITLSTSLFDRGDGVYELALLGTSNSTESVFDTRETSGGGGPRLIFEVRDPSTIETSGDTYVMQGSPTTNVGTNTGMGVHGSGSDQRITYLKFPVTGIAGETVSSVKLRLEESVANSDGNTSFQVVKTTSAWTEAGVTWNTKPTVGGTVYGTYTAGQLSNGGVVYIDLDPSLLNAGDGTYEIALVSTANSTESIFDTRETGEGAALVIGSE